MKKYTKEEKIYIKKVLNDVIDIINTEIHSFHFICNIFGEMGERYGIAYYYFMSQKPTTKLNRIFNMCPYYTGKIVWWTNNYCIDDRTIHINNKEVMRMKILFLKHIINKL